MDETSSIDSGNIAPGSIAPELEDLLSLPVSKDYINCVWTSVPDSDIMDVEGSPKKLVITAVTEAQPDGTASDKSAIITPPSVPTDLLEDPPLKDKPSSPLIRVRKKKVSKSKKEPKTPTVENLKKKSKNMQKKSKRVRKKCNETSATVVESPCHFAKPSITSVASLEDTVDKQTSKYAKTFTIVSHPVKIDPNLLQGKRVHDATLTTAADECLFDAYKKLVVERSLPQYAPKYPHSRFFLGNYFSCAACGDKYILQSSFIGHMSRKTTKFSYQCPICKAQLCFDNRCSFLLHISSHGLGPDDIKPGELIVLPSSSIGNDCDALFENISSNYIRCLECSKLVTSLPIHLEGNDELDVNLNSARDLTLTCAECSLYLPTKCALSAHERYHKGDPPHLCPECGESFVKSSTLINHMQENCLHNVKKTVFRCNICIVLAQSVNVFTDHFAAKHIRSIYKCHLCGVSAVSVEDFINHSKEVHQLSGIIASSAALHAQVECDKCPGISIDVKNIQDHATFHTYDPKIMTTVFHCNTCQYMFATKQLLLSHRATCQGKTEEMHNALIDGSCSELSADVQSSFQSTVYSEGSRTEQASPVTTERASIAGKPGSSEDGGKDEQQLDVISPNGLLETQEKSVSCSNSGGTVEITVPEGGKTNEAKFKKNMVCKLCKKVVSGDKAIIKRHFVTQHLDIFMKAIYRGSSSQLPMQIVYTRMKDTLCGSDSQTVHKFINSASQKDSFSKSKSNVRVANKNRSKGSKIKNRSPLKVGAEAKKAMETIGFQCYKCPFATDNTESFRSHILLHKSNPLDLQCPECGLCFIVKPPLEKHLIAEHGIKNVDKYLIDNGFEENISEEEESPILDEESDSEELLPNQCKVCKILFDSSLLLEKHFRVHGGAFLLANMKARKSI